MDSVNAGCVVAVLASVFLQLPPQASENPLLGVWRGSESALPAVTLNVTDEGGTLSGAILFYMIRRDPGKEPTASPGIPGPLLHPQIIGNTLTFEASHRLAHPPRTLADPPVTFRLVLTGPRTARLTRGGDNVSLRMTRDEYP